MANVLVGQFLPDGVVKGGSSLKLRYGNRATRVTTDFDAAAKYDREEFIAALQKKMNAPQVPDNIRQAAKILSEVIKKIRDGQRSNSDS